MKQFIFILILCASSYAATPITVTGVAQSGSTSGLKGNSFTRFRLRNYAGFVPRVIGTGILVQTQFDVRPTDSLGDFTTPIYSNDDIVPNTCDPGGVTACTWWTIEYWNDGKIQFSGNYCIPNTNPTYDLTSAVPCQTPPLPPAPAQPFGTVTSVAFTGDGTVFNSVVPGSPITTFGTFAPTLHTQSANGVFAGPTSGGAATPTFRNIVSDDFGTQTANFVLAGPTSGGAAKPTFRALGLTDLPAGTGTVTSVAFTGDGVVFNASVTGSPVTTSGTFVPSLHTQSANFVFAGPTSGGAATPTFRGLTSTDVSGLYSGTSPIVVTGTVVSCPTCNTNNPIKILSAAGPFTCSGDQTVCAFTITWPTTWADTNYTAVCNPVGPSTTSGDQSLANGGEGHLTTTTIDVYATSQGSSSKTYSNWTCYGIHN